MTSKFDSIGQPFVGGMDLDAEKNLMEEATADAEKMNEPIWKFSGSEGWVTLQEHMQDLINRERTRLEDSKTIDDLRFSQGFIKSLQRVIHFVEINSQYFESLQEEKLNISISPDD